VDLAMIPDILKTVPHRRGHFRMESGYHADLWLDLDALFASPREIAPLVAELARRLARYEPSAICGPLLGGAFLAQSLAAQLGVDFYFAEPAGRAAAQELFGAAYRLPAELHRRARERRVALVDEVISAGSSVRAAADALGSAGATIAVVGTLLLLGTKGADHFAGIGIPLETLDRREFAMWAPDVCPLCRTGAPLEDPTMNVPPS